MPMKTRKNRRGREEHFVSGRHLNLNDLKQEARHLGNQYLNKENIPNSPKPEFHVTRLKHDTDQDGLRGIRRDEGFRVPYNGWNDPHKGVLLWWSLAVDHEEVKSAETRLLQQKFSNLTEDEATMHPSFLYKFTSSPAFSEKSRLGSYRFTFNLKDVLEAYSLQFCSGDQPIMRVYETVLHKQEVQHTVLVHSPANQELFSKYYPLLTDDPNAVCVYKDDHFIWRPYAMCKEHRYELVERPGENQMDAHECNKKHFYIWDHVTIALHVDKQVLKFDADQLRKNLKFCYEGAASIGTFDSFEDAKNQVKDLWPDCDSPLDKECSVQQRFTDLRLVLVGRTGSGKSSSGNIILARDAFSTGDAAAGNIQCFLQMEKVFDWEVTVVDTPGLSETFEIQTEILKCIAMLAPGPHAFLLVIKVWPQINQEQDAVRQMEEIFGKNIWSHTFVVLNYNDQPKIDVQILEKNKTELKKILPGRVEDRCYVLNSNQQVWDLLDEVAKMAVANNVYSCKDTVIQDLRLVLVGRTGSGKSSSGNFILGRDAFSTGGAAASSSSGNAQCCLQMEKVFDWEVTVVDTPGLSEKLEMQMEILKCIAMLAPGPHAFLPVIKVGPQINEGQDAVRQMEEIFGKNVWSHAFVVLNYNDQPKIDVQILEKNKTELKKILPDRVEDRCYILNNNQQVWDLLDEVAKMAVANNVYSCKDTVIQDLRLVLVGRTGSGKSSSGNIILGRDAFSKYSQSGNAQCCLQTKKVFHWKMTVVETPGFSEIPEVKTEIRRCVDMLAPGPHAFLLVIKVGPQMDEEQDTMRQMEEIFGENVWWFTFVVLIYDDQSETDVELQVVITEDELKKILPQRVEDRYYNLNINSWNSLQDYYLLREVEKMVVANRGKFYSVQDSAKKRKITDVDDAKID